MVGYEPDTSATAAVATVGAALGDVCFTTERHTARAAIATLHIDVAFVYEVGLHGTFLDPRSVGQSTRGA